jgi:hypothetical protein
VQSRSICNPKRNDRPAISQYTSAPRESWRRAAFFRDLVGHLIFARWVIAPADCFCQILGFVVGKAISRRGLIAVAKAIVSLDLWRVSGVFFVATRPIRAAG